MPPSCHPATTVVPDPRGTLLTETTRIVPASRPHGEPADEDFRTETVELPAPADGEVLLQALYLSLDPCMRGRTDDRDSHAEPVRPGDTMVGATVSRVLESRDPSVGC